MHWNTGIIYNRLFTSSFKVLEAMKNNQRRIETKASHCGIQPFFEPALPVNLNSSLPRLILTEDISTYY
jgi:hypothetical protein